MSIEAIVFDFGNVIAHFDHRRAFEPLAAYTSMSVENMLARVIGDTIDREFDSGQMSEDEFLNEVKRRCELACEMSVIREHLAEIFSPNQSVCELIPSLKSHALYLLSNTNSIHAERFRKDYQSTLCGFRKLFLSFEMRTRKPEPGIFEQAQREIDLPPNKIVFVDDLQANVDAARACGWNGIVYTNIEALQKELKQMGLMITP